MIMNYIQTTKVYLLYKSSFVAKAYVYLRDKNLTNILIKSELNFCIWLQRESKITYFSQ